MQTNFLKPILLAAILMASSYTSEAQYYFAATYPDITADAAEEPENVNCDHYDFEYAAQFYNFNAVVWDNYPTSGSPYVKVFINLKGYDPVGNRYDTIVINNATHPDVIIGTDNVGNVYLGVVYEQSGQAILNIYDVIWSILGTPSFVGLSLNTSSTLSTAGEWPHIDGYADISAGVTPGFVYPVPEYVVSWQDNTGSTSQMKLATGDFPSASAPTNVSGLNWMLDNVVNSDVSAYTNDAGIHMANIVLTRTNTCGAKEMWVEAKDVTTTTASTATLLESGADLSAPRIESQNWKPVAHAFAPWIVVCPKYNTTTSRYDPIEYDANNVGAVQNVMPGFANNYECTAISGGLGENIPSSSYIAAEFTPRWNISQGMMMYGTGTAKLKFGVIGSQGGIGSLSDTSYGPNKTNELPPYTGFPVAAATSTGSGNNMLVAFGTHTTVSYKLVYDTTNHLHFRPDPTGLGDNELNNNIHLYANPTSSNISVSGLAEASYTIYNILGKKVGAGEMVEDKPIQTEQLAPGTYYIQLADADKVYKLQFVKQ